MKTYSEERPWGNFTRFTKEKVSTVKIIELKARKRFSLQYHKSREEFWIFLDNPALVTLGKERFRAKRGDEIFVKKKELHRIEALAKPVRILEIAFGKFNEKDITRIEDDYGRR